MTDQQSPNRRQNKVERVIDRYRLEDFGEQLEQRWTAPEDSDSLRDLADLMNQAVLHAALRDVDADVLEGEVENLYRLLTNEDATEGMRVQAKSALQSKNVDVEQLLTDFVSHQAIHTYLTEVRGVSKNVTKGDPVESAIESIQKLRGRLVAVLERSLESLRNASRIRLGDFDVLVDTQIYCRECGSQYDVIRLLERGGCDCRGESNSE
jgi:hypothetical protein